VPITALSRYIITEKATFKDSLVLSSTFCLEDAFVEPIARKLDLLC